MCVLLHMDLSREYDCVCGFGFVRGEDMDLCLGEDMNVCRLSVSYTHLTLPTRRTV